MDLALTEMPDGLVDILNQAVKPVKSIATTVKSGSPLDGVAKGARNNAVFNYGCSLVKGGQHPDEIGVLLSAKAARCVPPMKSSEVTATLNSVLSYQTKDEVPVGYDAHALLAEDLLPPDWIIPGILPVGLTVVAGDPKVGKSWLMLDIGVQVATGGCLLGKVDMDKGQVLYLALEDTPFRLKDRMIKLLGSQKVGSEMLKFHTVWSEADTSQLESSLRELPDIKICVIDTLARFRSDSKANSNLYEKDYKDIAILKSIADKLGIAIVVVHHLRKMKDADPHKMISGTQGIAGAADTNWVLEKIPGKAAINLHIRGRDVEEQLLSLEFNDFHWDVVGSFEIPPSALELSIVKLIAIEAMSPKDISSKLGLKKGSISKLLQRMVKKDQISKQSHGFYIGK